MLRLFLFGAPRVELNSQVVPLRRTKALALLAYLATIRQPHNRDALLALLWPDFDTASARNNLRRELSLLRSTLGEELLRADRLQLAWDDRATAWVDVAVFHEHVVIRKQHAHATGALCESCAAALATAAQLYTGDFLAGFGLPDSPAFDEWQFFEREELRKQLAGVLEALVGWHSSAGAYESALEYARRWLALDPLHEPAQRELMRLYALVGQRAAALRQYAECARLLETELGAKPEPETTTLYQQIKSRRLMMPAAIPGTAVSANPADVRAVELRRPAYLHQQPIDTLPRTAGFVGRQRDLADIIRRLTDPACRLLTLTGPGGIGKTHLALQVAQTLAEGWAGEEPIADGVLFVPLAAVDTSSGLVSALAAAARFEFYPNIAPQQQVIDYFRAKRMLVVLDNFEQLLDAAIFVTELLAAAPQLRLLITSRVALNLSEEWFHPIEGLAFPAEGDDTASVAQLARFDAVRLFEQHARRVRSDFSLSRAREPVVRLCRLVEGMPLAIELAASWLKLLSVEQLVTALERDLDILSARDRNIPERHRNMRAVLEESWRLLSADEQQTLARLTAFSGGFSAEAAIAVTGTSLDVLASLAEQALLRSAMDGRFQLHELLRQFAAEKLATDAHAARTTHERHSRYYLAFLAEREGRLRGCAEQMTDLPHARLAAVVEIGREAANVRAAWRWAVEQCDLAALDGALYSYFIYFYTRGYVQEGEEAFRHATAISIQPEEPLSARVRARALIRRGAFCYLLGDYESAIRSIEEGLAVRCALAIEGDVACSLITRGSIAGWRGDVETARQYLSAGLARGRALDDTYLVADALHELARLNGSYGDYREGKRLAHEALAISRAAGLIDWTAHALLTLGWSAVCCGEFAEAEACYRESLELARQIGDKFGVAEALGGIGWIAWCVGGARLHEARACIEQSLATARLLDDSLHISNYVGDLALIALDQGDYEQAWAYGQEGLARARELDSAIYVAYHLCILGHVAAARREFAASREYLREALYLTSKTRLWPMLAFSFYHVALLLSHEAATLDINDQTYAARKARTLELLTAVAHHLATWHVYKVRAMLLIDELRRDLPPDLADAAIAQGRRLDWQASIEALIDEPAAFALVKP